MSGKTKLECFYKINGAFIFNENKLNFFGKVIV